MDAAVEAARVAAAVESIVDAAIEAIVDAAIEAVAIVARDPAVVTTGVIRIARFVARIVDLVICIIAGVGGVSGCFVIRVAGWAVALVRDLGGDPSLVILGIILRCRDAW